VCIALSPRMWAEAKAQMAARRAVVEEEINRRPTTVAVDPAFPNAAVLVVIVFGGRTFIGSHPQLDMVEKHEDFDNEDFLDALHSMSEEDRDLAPIPDWEYATAGEGFKSIEAEMMDHRKEDEAFTARLSAALV
jgi:hypothetical protein